MKLFKTPSPTKPSMFEVSAERPLSLDNREMTKVPIKEFDLKVSDGLHQRVLAAYNYQTGDFDEHRFLEFPEGPKPAQDQALAFFSHAASGCIDYSKLLAKLPPISNENFQQVLYTRGGQDQLLFPEEYEIIRGLVGYQKDGWISQERLADFYQHYGGSADNLLKLVYDLQRQVIDEQRIINIARFVHGFRTDALVAFSNLNEIVTDSRKWSKAAKAFTNKTQPLLPQERERILTYRKALGYPDQQPDQQQEKNQPQRVKQQTKRPSKEKKTFEKFAIAGGTDRGQERASNEDAYYIDSRPSSANTPAFIRFAVFDGVGGQSKGEVASAMARDSFIADEKIQNSDGTIGTDLKTLIENVNSRIHQRSIMTDTDGTSYYGMGTTAVAAELRGDKLTVAHVGDSRAYLIRGGIISRLTSDHSWVEEQVTRGLLTPQEAAFHPQRNVITRSLGKDNEVAVDINECNVVKGDVIILCTDGLNSMIGDSEIANIASRSQPDDAVRQLIGAANKNGGADNITVVVARV